MAVVDRLIPRFAYMELLGIQLGLSFLCHLSLSACLNCTMLWAMTNISGSHRHVGDFKACNLCHELPRLRLGSVKIEKPD